MNKTISVNIGGTVFNIEEDAYLRLKNYLDAIAKHFSQSEGRDEIMSDIEARMAELFTEVLGKERQVILLADVEHIVSVMGQPEEYGDAGEGAPGVGSEKSSRRLFRDPDNASVGGVAAGLSHYFGWDPVGIRIAFVLLTIFGGSGLPIYIILWLVMPEARTTAEKLQMKGSRINVDNISKKVNQQFESATETLKSKKVRDGFERFFDGVGQLLKGLFKLFRVLIGAVFLALGVALAVSVIVGIAALMAGTNLPPMLESGFLKQFFFLSSGWYYTTWVGVLLLVLVPIASLFYGGIRMVLNLQTQVKGIGIVLVTTLILGSIITFTSTIFHVAEYSKHEALDDVYRIAETADTLHIRLSSDPFWHKGIKARHGDITELVKEDDGRLVFGNPLLAMRPADGEQFELRVTRHAAGSSTDYAIEHARNVSYEFKAADSLLTLPPYFTAPGEDKYHAQRVRMVLFIPEGKFIALDSSIDRILRSDNGLDMRSGEAGGKVFVNRGGEIVWANAPADTQYDSIPSTQKEETIREVQINVRTVES